MLYFNFYELFFFLFTLYANLIGVLNRHPVLACIKDVDQQLFFANHRFDNELFFS